MVFVVLYLIDRETKAKYDTRAFQIRFGRVTKADDSGWAGLQKQQ